jgi:hypothetical protein
MGREVIALVLTLATGDLSFVNVDGQSLNCNKSYLMVSWPTPPGVCDTGSFAT